VDRADGGSEVRSVAELPEFPFESFEAFRQAVDADRALVWVRYDFRAVWALYGCADRAFHLILVGAGLWLSLILVVWGVVSNNYWLWLGIRSGLLGASCASPRLSLIDGCFPIITCAVGMVASFIWGGDALFLAGAVSALSWFVTSAGLGTGNMAVRDAMVQSEETFLWLYSRRTITAVMEGELPVP